MFPLTNSDIVLIMDSVVSSEDGFKSYLLLHLYSGVTFHDSIQNIISLTLHEHMQEDAHVQCVFALAKCLLHVPTINM